MSFPSYMWSNSLFCVHRHQFWYVLQDLDLDMDMDADLDADPENSTETYYEVYSDY